MTAAGVDSPATPDVGGIEGLGPTKPMEYSGSGSFAANVGRGGHVIPDRSIGQRDRDGIGIGTGWSYCLYGGTAVYSKDGWIGLAGS